MNRKLLTIGALLCLGITTNAQTFFAQNFDSGSITNLINDDGSSLSNSLSGCTGAAFNTASTFNSTNINFGSGNSTNFLAINPETPCGGWYTGTVKTATPINLSSASGLKLKCKYFTTNTLGWGDGSITIKLVAGSAKQDIVIPLSTKNAWTSFEKDIDKSMINSSVNVTISLEGGEGIAIDDIEIVNVLSTNSEPLLNTTSVKVYPNPATSSVVIDAEKLKQIEFYTITGKSVLKVSNNLNKVNPINISSLVAGTYFVKVTTHNDQVITRKILKR